MFGAGTTAATYGREGSKGRRARADFRVVWTCGGGGSPPPPLPFILLPFFSRAACR